MDVTYTSIIKDALEDKLANDVMILEITELTTIGDYMIIADANNVNQLDALENAVYDKLAKEKIFPKNTEGKKESGWVLMDYGDIIVQLFLHDTRKNYDLEHIWSDAKQLI